MVYTNAKKSFPFSTFSGIALLGIIAGLTALPSPARQRATSSPVPHHSLTAALRLGDRVWLDELNNDPERAKLAVNLLLLTAMRFLKSSDYAECRDAAQKRLAKNPKAAAARLYFVYLLKEEG